MVTTMLVLMIAVGTYRGLVIAVDKQEWYWGYRGGVVRVVRCQ